MEDRVPYKPYIPPFDPMWLELFLAGLILYSVLRR